MKKAIVKYFYILVFITALIFIQKLYRKYILILRLEQNLPKYLENIYGIKPQVNIVILFNQVILEVIDIVSAKVSEEELIEVIKKHITEFYPLLNINRISIEVK